MTAEEKRIGGCAPPSPAPTALGLNERDFEREEGEAYVFEENGVLMLVDPVARQVERAIAKQACEGTYKENLERIEHFRNRAKELGRQDEMIIVLLNMNDPFGSVMGDDLMPGQDAMWEEFRSKGQVPFARGLAERSGVTEAVRDFDPEASAKIDDAQGRLPVLVVDHLVAEVFYEG